MKRFKVVLPIVVATALAAAEAALPAPARAVELKLAHVMSPEHEMDRFLMRPWAAELAKLSDHTLEVRIFPKGALGKGPVAQFRRAIDGVADITFGRIAFTSELFPRTSLIELPGVATDAVDGTNKLWSTFDLLAPEWRRVEVLALWVDESQILMTKNKKITTIAAMKDLKFRVPSKAQGRSLQALGAVPVFMPLNRVYNALNIGIIDGILAGPSTIRSRRFSEVAKYYTVGLPFGRSPYFLVMNRRSFARLSRTHRDIVVKSTGRPLSVGASRYYMQAGKEGLDSIRNSGQHEIVTLAGAALREGVDRLMAWRESEVVELERKGVPATAILKAMGATGG